MGVSALAIALGVYAIVLQEHGWKVVLLAAVVLLVAAGAVLQVSRAVRLLHDKQEELRRSAARAERHYFKVLRRVAAAIEAREPYTRGRSKRVGLLARQMAEKMSLPSRQCRLLGLAAQVHDIGLLSVPDGILNKPAKLAAQEFRSVKKHPEVSFRILEPLNFLAEVLPAVRYHHERMNGTGYPYGLSGDQLPVSARILAVADAFDAMTHDRPHRRALSALEAVGELHRCSPAGYDEKCIAALEEVAHVHQIRMALEPAAMPEPPKAPELAVPLADGQA